MRKLYVSLFVLLTAIVLSSCERRALENEIGDLAVVPVHIDWSQSGLDVSTMGHASVWFFPQNGEPPIKHIAEGNLVDTEVMLPEGVYSVVVFNRTTEPENPGPGKPGWSNLQFEGSDSYSTFRVTARPGTLPQLKPKGDGADMRLSPDAISSWSLDRFEVSAEMIRATAMGTRVGQTDRSERIHAIPRPLTKAVKIQAYVQNLTSSVRCSGTLTGVVGGVLLSSGEAYTQDASHGFIMNDRIYDKESPHDGYIHANLLIFNIKTDTKTVLDMDFVLHGGGSSSPDPFDVTDQITPDKPEVKIEVGFENEEEEKDHPIILPEVPINEDVGVDDWKDEEKIPIT